MLKSFIKYLVELSNPQLQKSQLICLMAEELGWQKQNKLNVF
jgi:hypothetical protein